METTQQKSHENRMSTSVNSSGSMANSIERKVSLEEKRSVTSSHTLNSLNNSQPLNESGKSNSSVEHQHQSNSICELDEEVLELDNDGGRCNIM